MVPESEKLHTNGAAVANRVLPRREPAAPALTVVEHPLAQQALDGLTDHDVTPDQFRTRAFQVLCLLFLEATRSPGIHSVAPHPTSAPEKRAPRPVIVLSINRHGLALAHRLREIFPEVVVGGVSFARSTSPSGSDPRLHLSAAPVFGDARVILFNPVLTTGSSTQRVIGIARRAGATDIGLITFALNDEARALIQTDVARVPVWTAFLQRVGETRRVSDNLIRTIADRMEERTTR